MLDLDNTSTRSIPDGISLRSRNESPEVTIDRMRTMSCWDMGDHCLNCSGSSSWNGIWRASTMGCILWMRVLIRKQTLQLWQEEEWRNLKCRPFQKHQCKLSCVQFVNLLSTWWKSVLRCQLWEKCLGIKQMLLDNSSPIIMLHIATPTIQIGGTIWISLGSQGHLSTCNLVKHPRKSQVLN